MRSIENWKNAERQVNLKYGKRGKNEYNDRQANAIYSVADNDGN